MYDLSFYNFKKAFSGYYVRPTRKWPFSGQRGRRANRA